MAMIRAAFLVSGLAFAFMMFGDQQVGAYCYRMACDSPMACKASQASTEGPCCCTVSCSGGGGTVECTCTLRCSTNCLSPCPNCSLQQCQPGFAANEAFEYTPDLRQPVTDANVLVAQVLDNVSRGSGSVASGPVHGKSSVGGNGDYGYRGMINANPTRVVVEIVFDRVGNGPLPEPVKVEIDKAGYVATSALAAQEAEALVKTLRTACGARSGAEVLTEAALKVPGPVVTEGSPY